MNSNGGGSASKAGEGTGDVGKGTSIGHMGQDVSIVGASFDLGTAFVRTLDKDFRASCGEMLLLLAVSDFSPAEIRTLDYAMRATLTMLRQFFSL